MEKKEPGLKDLPEQEKPLTSGDLEEVVGGVPSVSGGQNYDPQSGLPTGQRT